MNETSRTPFNSTTQLLINKMTSDNIVEGVEKSYDRQQDTIFILATCQVITSECPTTIGCTKQKSLPIRFIGDNNQINFN